MPHEEWLRSLITSVPRFFNVLSGRCTLVLSGCIVECSKAILSAQSPVLHEYFMSSERDINALIAERRKRFLAQGSERVNVGGERGRDSGDDVILSDDEEDDTSVLVLTDYYGYDDIVSEFFRSFYTGEISINSDTYRVTIKLGCQYEVAWVISECCTFLEDFLNEDNFIDHLKFLMGLKEERINSIITSKLRSFDYCTLLKHNQISSEWLKLDIDMFVVVLNNLQPPSETFIAHLVFMWLEHDVVHRKTKFETLISNIGLVNLPQSLINEVVLQFAEVHSVDSTALYRMVLGTQTYFFSRMIGSSPRRNLQDNFPRIYESRSSYLRMEEYEFKVSVSDLSRRAFVTLVTDSVTLVCENGSNCYRLAFSHHCCFVYITDSVLVEKYPISKILIPVLYDADSTVVNVTDGTVSNYVSENVDVFKDIVSPGMEPGDKILKYVSLVAVFLYN